MKIRVIAAVLGAVGILFVGGCAIGGAIVAPTSHEKKIPAEYKLKGTQQKVMVVVEEARSSSAGFNFQAELDDTISAYLVKKVGVKNENVVRYREYRAKHGMVDTSLSPAKIGAEAGADLVLYVRIEKYDLQQMDTRGFFSGHIATQSVLLDTEEDKVVWPADEKPKLARIRVDMETAGRNKTNELLCRATAHCITRHLYDCPTDRFRSGYEETVYNLNRM